MVSGSPGQGSGTNAVLLQKRTKLETRTLAVAMDSKVVCCSELGMRCTELCSCVRCENFDVGDDSLEVDSTCWRSNERSTFAFWSSYMQMVESVLLLTRATRSGDWELHLSSVRKILPWMFAYDRPNYARYLSAYFLELCDLPAFEALATGEFAVHRQDKSTF